MTNVYEVSIAAPSFNLKRKNQVSHKKAFVLLMEFDEGLYAGSF